MPHEIEKRYMLYKANRVHTSWEAGEIGPQTIH